MAEVTNPPRIQKKRVSTTHALPLDQIAELDQLAERFGASRSKITSALIAIGLRAVERHGVDSYFDGENFRRSSSQEASNE